jgi:hypothetical protein
MILYGYGLSFHVCSHSLSFIIISSMSSLWMTEPPITQIPNPLPRATRSSRVFNQITSLPKKMLHHASPNFSLRSPLSTSSEDFCSCPQHRWVLHLVFVELLAPVLRTNAPRVRGSRIWWIQRFSKKNDPHKLVISEVVLLRPSSTSFTRHIMF